MHLEYLHCASDTRSDISRESYEVGVVIIPILQIRKLRP